MRIKIKNFLYRLRSSFWLLPSIMTGLAIVLGLFTTILDERFFYRADAKQWWLYRGGPDGAGTLLSVIAGSMITVAGVVFSITIVVLTLASSQFGPRLIRNFMNVRANQIVLGTFVATFIYCILILRTVNGVEGEFFVPSFSVSIAIVMSLLSLGVLIYFIHSVSESIQAQNIIARVRGNLDDAVDRIFPEKLGQESDQSRGPIKRDYDIPTTCDRESCQVKAECDGYLQAMDTDTLMRLAVEENLLIHVDYRPGDFVTRDRALVTVWPGVKVDETLSKKVNAIFIVGPERTLEQDVEFAISQLVEIAVRALSPGINDPNTAITCIDWLGASLCQLGSRKMPSSHRYDENNRLRIISKPYTFDGMVNAAFDMIRQNSDSVPAVSIHLLETIAMLAAQTPKKESRRALLRQAAMLVDGCKNSFSMEDDHEDLEIRYQAALAALENNAVRISLTSQPSL